jgi:hypothetical protein
MQVSGILDTALSVEDLAALAAFYKRLFGFETERLFALNVARRNLLLLFNKGPPRSPWRCREGSFPATALPGEATSPSRSRLRRRISDPGDVQDR